MNLQREKKILGKQVLIVGGLMVLAVLIVTLGLREQPHHHNDGSPLSSQYLLPSDEAKVQEQWLSQGEEHLHALELRQKKLEEIISNMPSASVLPSIGTTLSHDEPTLPMSPIENRPLPVVGVTAATRTGPEQSGQSAQISINPARPLMMRDNEVQFPAADHKRSDDIRSAESEQDGMINVEIGSENNDQHRQDYKNFVPAGSFAKVVLLSGFDAPTGGQAAQNALPVVMRVKSFMHMPNNFANNLKECFITGSGYGDLASERAFIRTERISCVLQGGGIIEQKIKGHVVGQDASFGMRGRVVSKQGALLARSFLAGLFSGLGNSVALQSQTLQASPLGTVATVDPSRAMQSALGTGVSTSSGKIADFYLQQANLIFPVIEISAMRIGEVFLVEGVDLSNSKDKKAGSDDKIQDLSPAPDLSSPGGQPS